MDSTLWRWYRRIQSGIGGLHDEGDEVEGDDLERDEGEAELGKPL